MSNNNLWIDVKIAYEPGRNLGVAYNRAMKATKAEWVLFLDHDLFICNPHWYEMSIKAIKEVGDKCGWITCVTNRIGNPGQKPAFDYPPPESNDVLEHVAYAKELYKYYGDRVLRFKGALSGFYILTSKRAWRKVGGFNEAKKFFGIDNDYSRRLSKANYQHYGLPGLYFYHLYKQKDKFMRW